jgi:predicted metal-dependent peptidase
MTYAVASYRGPLQTHTGSVPGSAELERMLETAKISVFVNNNAAFLGSLLCSHDFVWDHNETVTKSAATDGIHVWWSVLDFLRCSAGEKGWTILHELWHTGLMHNLRQGTRDPQMWNVACDYRINNNLIYDGCQLPDNGYWIFNTELDKNGILAEEEIYDLLVKKKLPMPPNAPSDLKFSDKPADKEKTLAAVVRAVQAAELSNKAGNLPGVVKKVLNTFLEPQIPWKTVLHRWMTDLIDEVQFTWRRPNRRYQDIYLPSHEEPEGRLEHLVYFQDTSGSISDEDMHRFNSEVKYVQEVLKPKKLTLVQFDTKIQYTREFVEDEPFEDVAVHGRGGTCLRPVHAWIEEHKPTAAVIFSDLWCYPMESLSVPIPIIWVAIRNQTAVVPFGQIIHIN